MSEDTKMILAAVACFTIVMIASAIGLGMSEYWKHHERMQGCKVEAEQ